MLRNRGTKVEGREMEECGTNERNGASGDRTEEAGESEEERRRLGNRECRFGEQKVAELGKKGC
jgi:hypothetical protein